MEVLARSVLAVLILDQNKTPVLIRQILDINFHAAEVAIFMSCS